MSAVQKVFFLIIVCLFTPSCQGKDCLHKTFVNGPLICSDLFRCLLLKQQHTCANKETNNLLNDSRKPKGRACEIVEGRGRFEVSRLYAGQNGVYFLLISLSLL